MSYNYTSEGAKDALKVAYINLYNTKEVRDSINQEHIIDSPSRIVESTFEMFKGCWEKPEDALSTIFTNTAYDEIVYINDINFVSMCAHHNLNFLGKMHFGYLPDKGIVGLSKIPRLVNVYAKRPQLQEKLTQDIVDSFMRIVAPLGCGLVVEAWHLCMMIRGIESRPTYTKTTALRGSFKANESTKQEFLNGIKQASRQIWP